MEIAHVFFRSEALLASPAKERRLVSRIFPFLQQARRSWLSSPAVSASSGSPARSVSSRLSPSLAPSPSSPQLLPSASSARFSSPRAVCALPGLRRPLGGALAAAEPAAVLWCASTRSRSFCISLPSPKKLSDVVKLPLLRLKSREEIAEIWAEHFHSKPLSVAASTAHDAFERVAAK
uniref:Uncharacterized protein n=1 Tax=Toxoplasma gondii TgCATBr9 TaxID=943120 RepID=A0A2T6ILP4_TOXGO|nr:hypothetical protein TGBR9_358660 [Toxoplasma gondii TgCATBr9]